MADRALTVTFIGNDAQLSAAFKRVGAQLNGLQRAGSGLQSLGGSLTRNVTLPIVGIGVAAAKMASDFQSAMERIHTQAGVSQKAVGELSDGVLKLAGKVGEAPTELADGMYHVASSLNATLPAAQRVSTELKVLKTAAEGARVGNANLVDVTNALDAAVVSGIKGVQNYQQAMGALNAVVGAGDMKMQDLADALGTGLLAPMKTYGVTLNAVGGALAVFGDNNIRGQEAATKLISAVRIMAAPSAKAADALAQVNLGTLTLAKDLRSNGNQGLIVALEDLKKHMEDAGLSASQQGLLIARAFGGRQSTGMQVLLDQLGRLKVKTDDVGKGAQAFGSAWAATQQTAAQKTADALATMKADLTQFGGDVLPTLLSIGSTIVNDVDKVAKDFESLPQGLQNTIIKGGLVLATVGPALKILGLFTSGLGRLYSLVNGKTFTSIVGGGTAAAPTTRAASQAVAASPGLASSVAGGLRTGVSRGLQGLSIAGLGVAVSQTVGSSMHGAVGAAVKSIGTDASIGAGMGAFFGPEGIAGGAMIGGLVGAFKQFIGNDAEKEGQAFADKFTAPLAPAVAKKFNSSIAAAQTKINTTQQTQQVRRNIAASPGLARGGPGGGGQPAASAAALEKQFHDEGVKLGEATVAGLKSVKDPSSSILLSDFVLQLKKLPGQAQPEAAKTMLDFAIGLEQSGKIPYKSLQGIIKGLEGQVPGFSAYLNNQGQVINQVFSKTLMLSPASATLKATLAGYRQQFGDWSISTKVTAGNIDQTISTAMAHLHTTVATSSGQTRKDAVAELSKLHDQTIALFNSMGSKVQTSIKSMSTAIKGGSASAARVASENLGSFASNVETAMSNSVLGVGQGMKLIIDNTNKALKEMGQKQLSPIQVASMSLNIGKQSQLNATANGAARGGIVQFGRAGAKGRDTIPVNFGGAHIAVGSGEVGMVANHDQQAFLNARTADVGGLPGVFSKFSRPHYMATGGFVQAPGTNYSVGEEPQIAAALDRMGRALGIVLTGISGYRTPAHSVEVGGFADDPHTRGDASDTLGTQSIPEATLERFGLTRPFGGAAEADHMQLLGSVLGPIVNGAAGSAAAAMVQQITAPKVSGTGAMATLVRAAVDKATTAANSYLGSNATTGMSGAGIAPGSWLTVAQQIAARFGWGASEISAWRGVENIEDPAYSLTAQNPTSPAYGLAQGITGPSWYYGEGGNPNTIVGQLTAMANYIHGRYGTPSAALAFEHANNYYARGGMVGLAKGGAVGMQGPIQKLPYENKLQKKFANVTRLMGGMWKAAAPLLHQSGRGMPAVTYTQGIDGLFVGVDQTPGVKEGHRDLYLPDWFVQGQGKKGTKGYQAGIQQLDPTLLETVVHEWVHEFQNVNRLGKIEDYIQKTAPGVENLGGATEGGAEAFAKMFAPKVLAAINVRDTAGPETPDEMYYKPVQWVLKNLGTDWVKNGQFGIGLSPKISSLGSTAAKKAPGGFVGPLPFAGSFDKGGTIPGKVGSPSLAVVHGGEQVIPHFTNGGVLSTGSGLSAKIQRRDAEASLVKQQLNANLKQLASLEQALTDVSKQPALRNEITNLRAEEDTTKSTAKRADLRKQITLLEGRLQSVEGEQRSKLEKQIAGIKAQNQKLGGDETKVGTGGVLGGLTGPVSVGIPSQSIGAQIKLAGLTNAVTTAQNSGNTNAQKAALQKEMKYEKSWLSQDKKQLKRVNALLGKRGLSRKQRGQLLQDKLALIQEIGTVEGDIGGISSSLSDLASSSSTDTSGTDTSGTDTSSTDTGTDTSSTDALTSAIQDQTDAINQLQATIATQNAYMKSVDAVETGQAIKALSDVISGQIGGRAFSRMTGSAGDGSVARY